MVLVLTPHVITVLVIEAMTLVTSVSRKVTGHLTVRLLDE
jgi:hypothetical protein